MEDMDHDTISLLQNIAHETKLYVVVNKDCYFFRAKGRSGYGDTWVSRIEHARIFNKLSQARARVTYFKKKFPELPTPNIIQLNLDGVKVLSGEVERTKKVIESEEKREQKKRIERKKAELDKAVLELEKAQKVYLKLRLQELSEETQE